jgi:UDP-N-acetylglucosamine/UDP-N-acetylgalactosamine diphosphorylase
MTLSYDEAKHTLEQNGQEHVLRFWNQLNEQEHEALLEQLAALDFDSIARMKTMLAARDEDGLPFDPSTKPAPVVEPTDADVTQYRPLGEEQLRAGQVGVILVAGGQGSRLGFDGPKGAYGVAPITNATLFEIHSRKILNMERRYGTTIPFYIMTSDVNDAATRAFFTEHDHFGLDAAHVKFFTQGMWPVLDPDGRIIMDQPGHLFMSPDGHGGTLTALQRTGMLADMAERGVETLFFFQVDNPLVEIADPLFIGLHAANHADISIKVCTKRNASEGLGIVATCGGKCMIIEYSDMPDDQQEALAPDGRLKFLYGSVAIHAFDRTFLEQEASAALPLHIAHKKVPYCAEDGSTIRPEEPNAYKFEKFIFDVIPDAASALNVAFDRAEEFSPLKNAEGSDSPVTVARDLTLKHARWLEAAGIAVPRDEAGLPTVRVEIDPCYANSAEELAERLPDGFSIDGDVLLKDEE